VKAREIFKKITYVKTPYDAARMADALLLLTEWGEFANLDLRRIKKIMRHPLFFDGRNMFDPKEFKKLGFHYVGVGRGGLNLS